MTHNNNSDSDFWSQKKDHAVFLNKRSFVITWILVAAST